MDLNKSLQIMDLDNRDNIILVEYIGSASKTILPILLVSKVNI